MLCTAMLATAHCIHPELSTQMQAAAMTLTADVARMKDTMLRLKMRCTPLNMQRSNQEVTIYHSGRDWLQDSETG